MTTADDDPDYWSERMTHVIGQFSGQTVTREIATAMEEQLRPLRDCQRNAAHAAFPWVETWWEDTEDFVQLLSRKMTDEVARRIREVRVGGATWRSVAEWAYDHLRPSWQIGWIMQSHQQVGKELCDCAALHLGEDPNAAPWN